MDELEKVERLRKKADVSYEEAKQALEECGWDLLDAIVLLEKQGRVKEPKNTSYTTQYEEPEKIEEAASSTQKNRGGFSETLNSFFSWCGSMIQKGNETLFKVERGGKTIISVPVTVFVIILIITFWCVFVVMLVGLFCGCHYSFEGIDKVEVDVNKAMNSASNVAEKIKKEFTDGGEDTNR